MLRIDSLDHLVLTVESLDATRAFYADVLGLEVQTSAEGRTSLHFGRQKVNLHERGREIEPRAARPTPGSADFCLLSPGPASAVLDHLKAHNVPVEVGPVRREGARGPMTSVYVRDPDQNLVEIAVYAAP